MLFINWDVVGRYCFLFLVIVVNLSLLRVAAKKRKLLLIPAALLAVPIIALAVFFAVPLGHNTDYSALYSPDGKAAIRIRDWDAGTLDGGSTIRVYQNHGLRSTLVAGGSYHFVKPEQIHWLNNTEIQIDAYSYTPGACVNAGRIQVHCIAAPKAKDSTPARSQ